MKGSAQAEDAERKEKVMKVYVIGCGRLNNDINLSYSNMVIGTRENPNPETVWYQGPSYCVLIEHPTAGYILYDIGSAPNSDELWPSCITETCYYTPIEGETLTGGLAKIGLEPKDIKHIIISHMHMDHIGNIQLFKDTAEFYVTKAEAEFAFTTVMQSTDPSTHGFYNRADVLADLKTVHYVEEDGELFDGIHAVILPGHTPGVMGIIIELEEKNLLLTSDALNAQINYDGRLPGVIADPVSFFKSLKKIKKLEKQYNAAVWYGHDIAQFKSLKKIPEYYC